MSEGRVKEILCYGDSNTWGHNPSQGGIRYPYSQRWTTVMADALGAGYHVIAEGMNGRTTVFDDPVEAGRNGVEYLHTCLQSHKPLDLVLIMLGTNDCKERYGLLPIDIALGMKRLVKAVLADEAGPAIKVGIIAPPPIDGAVVSGVFSGGHRRSVLLAHEYGQVARDLHVAFFDAGSCVKPPMPDGIHLGPQEHRELGLAVAEWVKTLLA